MQTVLTDTQFKPCQYCESPTCSVDRICTSCRASGPSIEDLLTQILGTIRQMSARTLEMIDKIEELRRRWREEDAKRDKE